MTPMVLTFATGRPIVSWDPDNQFQAVDRDRDRRSALYASKKHKCVINLQRLFMVYSI
jgi:hypothetical protein